jgi:hypothetical protein
MSKKSLFQIRNITLALSLLILITVSPPSVLNTGPYPDTPSQTVQNEYLFEISLTDAKNPPIESKKLISYLFQHNSIHHSDLIGRIESLFNTLKPSQSKARLRLIEIAHLVGKISKSEKINQLFIDQCEKYSNSYQPIETEMSRLALKYYLELELDPQIQRVQINHIVSSIIHNENNLINGSRGTGHCSVPTLYLSKLECEHQAKQPCRLAAIFNKDQADVCWKPILIENSELAELYENRNSGGTQACKTLIFGSENQGEAQVLSGKNTHLKCRLNYHKSLLDLEQTSITYTTNCHRCSDTLLGKEDPENSPIRAILLKTSQAQAAWITDECRGNPVWNHEFQNGNNFSIEEIGIKNSFKNYFGYKLDQCSIKLARNRKLNYYF